MAQSPKSTLRIPSPKAECKQNIHFFYTNPFGVMLIT